MFAQPKEADEKKTLKTLLFFSFDKYCIWYRYIFKYLFACCVILILSLIPSKEMKRHDRPACRMEVLAGETNFFKFSDFFVDRTFSARIWQQCPVLSNSPHAQLGFFPVGPRYPCHRRHLSAPPGWPGHKFVLMGISIFLSVCL